MKKDFLYVANWKMQMSFLQSIAFAQQHYHDLIELSQQPNRHIVLCPSYEALASIAHIFKASAISIGAQNCSSQLYGPYTGQVSLLSLQEIGCSYVLVGHSEQKLCSSETDEQLADKANSLLNYNITPIFCIGESLEAYQNQQRFKVLEAQIRPLLKSLSGQKNLERRLCIAYEPIWAIGTGVIPSLDELDYIYAQIVTWVNHYDISISLKYLYGGSITDMNYHIFAQLGVLDGFLIGGASLNFKKFQNIVL